MRLNLFVALACLLLCFQAYGQDINCPVTESWLKTQKQKGRTALLKTTASTAAITGPQELVILFVDYPEGRIYQNGQYRLPTMDSDTSYFTSNDSIDGVGGMGWIIDSTEPGYPLRKKIRKYTYDDYWDMFFSIGTYYGSAHPDRASNGILAYGSMRDYYREVSYNKMDIYPYQTRPGSADKYHTGIVNAIDEANGKKYIRWIMMPKSKSSYAINGEIKTPYSSVDIDPVLRDLYNQGQINFNVDTYQGKIIIVGAGSCLGGITDGAKYLSVSEKRYHNYDTRSTLDGIWISVHEFGHTLNFSHMASSTYDPMNVTIRNEWTRHLYCPPHFNPIYKLQAGWITPDDVIKIRNDTTISLVPADRHPIVAAYTIYGDALRNNDCTHSEYFIVEYRKREGFNRFSGGQDSTSFTGGALIWHYSQYGAFFFDPYIQTSHIGLKIAGYCDDNNHSDFTSNAGDPQHFYCIGRNLIDKSTYPNTSSMEHLTTGIDLSNFTVAGDSMTITAKYTLGAVPDYAQFYAHDLDNIPDHLSGAVFIGGGTMPSNLTILDHTQIEFMARNKYVVYLKYLSANASSQNSISLRGAGFGSFRFPWGGILLQTNASNRSSIKNCLIADVVDNIGLNISIGDGHEPIVANNQFQNCKTDLRLWGTMFTEIGGYDNNVFQNIIITGDWKLTTSKIFSIPPNANLQISECTIRFDKGASLYCHGKLFAKVFPSPTNYYRPIIFTSTGTTSPGSWGSIVLNGPGASNSVLDGIRMQYGTNIQVLNGASNVIIENSVLDNNKGAVFFNNSSGSVLNNHIFYTGDYPGINIQSGSFVTCSMNNLKKTNGDCLNVGICFSGGANGTLWQNDIGYFNWGVGAIWGSSPAFWNQNYNGDNRNNRITNCQYGVMVYQNSYPEIGNYDLPPSGVSTIENNEVDIALNANDSTGSNLSAANIYWNNGNPGNARFMIGAGSSIRTSPYSTMDYWSNIPILQVQATGDAKGHTRASKQSAKTSFQFTVLENAVSDDSLLGGINLRLSGKFKEAKDFFVSYLGKHPDNQQAYGELYNCYCDETAEEVTRYFETLPTAAGKEQELLLSYLYLRQGNVQAAKEVNNRIISKNTKISVETMAKLGNFYITLYTENDPQRASMILDEAISSSPLLTSVELELGQKALMTYVDPNTGSMPYANDGRDTAVITPAQVGLIGNYPNPFHSTTVIVYQLSDFTRVILKVYDILGREVAILADEIKAGGRHTVTFDGSKLSSGIYFLRLNIKPQDRKHDVQVKKMLMIK